MNCKDVQEKIEVYLDRELTLSDQRDFEGHLNDCANCQLMLDNVRLLNDSIKKIDYVKAPFSLRRKIKSDLKDITGEDGVIYNKYQLFGFAAGSAVLASIVVWGVMAFMISSTIQTQLISELTEAHVRSLMVDHATDITTSDNHTVKPWFSGKLDFSPKVLNLKNDGFELIGGRLDYLRVDDTHKQPAAALIYKRRSHYINVFIYRDESTKKITQLKNTSLSNKQNQSYNLISWQAQDLNYWVVSDLNADELKQFAQLFKSI